MYVSIPLFHCLNCDCVNATGVKDTCKRKLVLHACEIYTLQQSEPSIE